MINQTSPIHHTSNTMESTRFTGLNLSPKKREERQRLITNTKIVKAMGLNKSSNNIRCSLNLVGKEYFGVVRFKRHNQKEDEKRI